MILRSLLFVPGNRLERVEKALASPADGVIIDLEDAVALSEKETARRQVGDFLRKADRKHIFVRVNGMETPFFPADLEEVVEGPLYGLLIPKAESPQALREADRKLREIEKKKSLPEGKTRILPQMETALGISLAREIGQSTPRVVALTTGAADLTLDLGAKMTKTGEELFFARASLVFAARLAGVYPIDSPWMIDFKDTEGLAKEARLSRQLGFRGKLCIHPAQIPIVNEIFSPAPEEVARAKKVVEAFEEARRRGLSAISLEGQFVDPPIFAREKQTLDFAKEIGLV